MFEVEEREKNLVEKKEEKSLTSPYCVVFLVKFVKLVVRLKFL